MRLYIDDFDRLSNISDSRLKTLFSRPRGHWFCGAKKNFSKRISRFAARTDDAVPICVLYYIPNRDLGSFSKGGAKDDNDYIKFIDQFADGLGNKEAIIIFEPDAIPHAISHSTTTLYSRINLINAALIIIRAKCKNAKVYIDIGHPRWFNSETISYTLGLIYNYHGISINVSNFVPTSECITYGDAIGKPYVIDTSRNGNIIYDVAIDGWCNPLGRRIGNDPTIISNGGLLDGFLWIKIPGESDGRCNGGPKAGTFWPPYALELLHDSENQIKLEPNKMHEMR